MTEVLTPLTDAMELMIAKTNEFEGGDANALIILMASMLKVHGRQLERELAVSKSRLAELERAIEDAPHEFSCTFGGCSICANEFHADENERCNTGGKCNCWKAAIGRQEE